MEALTANFISDYQLEKSINLINGKWTAYLSIHFINSIKIKRTGGLPFFLFFLFFFYGTDM